MRRGARTSNCQTTGTSVPMTEAKKKGPAIWLGKPRSPFHVEATAQKPDTWPGLLGLEIKAESRMGGTIDFKGMLDAIAAIPVPSRPRCFTVKRRTRHMQEGPVDACPPHTKDIFNPASMPRIVEWARAILERERIDAMIACGHSGLPLAGALSYLLHIPVFAVRKEGEQSRAGSPVVTGFAPNGPALRWAWVDDFIGSGRTFKRSREEVAKAGLIDSIIPTCMLGYATDQGYTKGWHMSADGAMVREITAGTEESARLHRPSGETFVPYYDLGS